MAMLIVACEVGFAQEKGSILMIYGVDYNQKEDMGAES